MIVILYYRLTDRQTYQQTDLLTDRQTNRPTDRPTNTPTSEPSDKSTDLPANRRTDQQTYRQTNLSTDQQTDLLTARPTDRPIDNKIFLVNLNTKKCYKLAHRDVIDSNYFPIRPTLGFQHEPCCLKSASVYVHTCTQEKDQ